jgi:hypothetical protein
MKKQPKTPKQTKSTAAEPFQRGQQIIAETKPEAPPAAVPDWVTETPAEAVYSLEMWDSDSTAVEDIYLSRAEYIALKQHLAGLRGIIPDPAAGKLIPSPTAEQDQEQEVRARFMDRLAGMSACTLRSLAWYADIEDADDGCNAPAEDFITTLVLHHSVRALTPDDATRKLEEFRENFDGMVRAARAFTARYPEAVKAATAA